MRLPTVMIAIVLAALLLVSASAGLEENPFPNATFNAGSFKDAFLMNPVHLDDGMSWTPGDDLSFANLTPILLSGGREWLPGTALRIHEEARLMDGSGWNPGLLLNVTVPRVFLDDGTLLPRQNFTREMRRIRLAEESFFSV